MFFLKGTEGVEKVEEDEEDDDDDDDDEEEEEDDDDDEEEDEEEEEEEEEEEVAGGSPRAGMILSPFKTTVKVFRKAIVGAIWGTITSAYIGSTNFDDECMPFLFCSISCNKLDAGQLDLTLHLRYSPGKDLQNSWMKLNFAASNSTFALSNRALAFWALV